MLAALATLETGNKTLADLAVALPDVGVVLVARSGLGTLNHTMLTREALSHRGIRLIGTCIGSWPEVPSVIETSNRDHLAGLPEGVLGAIPAGAPARPPQQFRAAAPGWLPGLSQA